MNRRTWLQATSSALLGRALAIGAGQGLNAASIKRAPFRIDAEPSQGLELERKWAGDLCRARLVNKGKQSARVREIVLFSIAHTLPAETRLYGESFQMLSQTAGTLGQPVDLGYSELRHYKLPQPEGATAVSSLMTLTPPGGETTLLAFTSSRRFSGRFYLRAGSIDVVMDAEGLTLASGEAWDLEEFLAANGRDRAALLERVGQQIERNHPPLRFEPEPAGWCSWYCFGPRVTADDVLRNLDAIASQIPKLKYVQIDDGYQPAMGDWLEHGKAFGGDVISVLKRIREKGFEPAIWVAPFIAEENSNLFRSHPDWFMKDASGQPLASNKVTFGGWRHGPWYALDGTHPEARRHLEGLFRTMRREWGCSYFKLDANFWGAMHGGRLHDPKATRVEAYRRGMEAILRGSGDGFILGCNHPMWASLGLIHGSRSSGDINRKWSTIRTVARQNLSRNWQNGRLWWNDPDAVVLTGDLPDAEFQFHATSVYASGGMVLSGDDLTKMPPQRLEMLRKLLPPTGIAARFEDESLRVGRQQLRDRLMISMFNWDDEPRTISARVPGGVRVIDYWSGEALTASKGEITFRDLPAHSARLVECRG